MERRCDRPTLRRRPVWVLLGTPLLLTACDDSQPKAAEPPPQKVEVAEAASAQIPLTREFVGTTAAIKLVEIRSKVRGYLQERPFTEGTDVKKGDVLFVIDQRPFRAEVEKIQGDLEHNQARLTFAQQQVDRYQQLTADSFASVQRLESVQSEALQAAGDVTASQAALENAQLDLEYSTITAPLDGRISNTEVNIGNLVSAENTLLTTLVQLDPIYAYFSPSEAAYQEMVPYQAKGPLQASIVLASGAAYPHTGTVDFVDNQVDTSTGTIKMRAVIPNPDKTQRPGQYVKVQLTLTDSYSAILVPAAAVTQDEGGHYVFVVDESDKVERRNIQLGTAYEDRYVIEDGIEAGEQVVVKGLQKIRGGQQVEIAKAVKTRAEGKAADDAGAGPSSGGSTSD
ncbi:MAG: efflux RND transporter periplasmic adaptor subunit [Pseudomonadota bacterium]